MARHGPPRTRLAPEVIQTSAMDCGPASLQCLLAGFGIPASYGRLREACQTGLDGTNIDSLEDAAVALGLDAEQVMLPRDHILLPEARALPAIAVTLLANGLTHFIVVWRVHGNLVQIMDPGTGRRWVTRERLLNELYRHAMPVPAADWRAWAGEGEFGDALARRITAIGVGRRRRKELLAEALADPGWKSLARLDAAVRMLAALPADLPRAKLLEGLLEDAVQHDAEAIPESYWSVRPHPQQPDEVILRAGVLIRVLGSKEPSLEALEPELAAAIREKPKSPWLTLFQLVWPDSTLALAAGLGVLLAALGVMVEALLLKGLLDIGSMLGAFSERAWAVGGLFTLVLLLFVLRLPLRRLLLALGRRLEARFRRTFLEKIPKLGDRYFSSRLTSDMTERAHAVVGLRELPQLVEGGMHQSLALGLTAAGIVWLDPELLIGTVVAVVLSVLVPLFSQKLLQERDLRVRSQLGALSRFYLDALLGLVPIRNHGAGRAMQSEHEGVLSEWARASLRLQGAAVALEGVQSLLGFGVGAWLLIDHLLRVGVGGGTLLLVYWVLKLPAYGSLLALNIRQLPMLRNIVLRLLEPLGAPELEYKEAEEAEDVDTPFAIELSGVGVSVSGNTILDGIDLCLEPGSHVAVVGPSGAGKSSLAGVLLGWHRPNSGQVHVDGAPLDVPALRRATAWVDPAVQLWNRSLAANLRYGEPGAVDLGPVLAQADLRSLLETLPEGLQTPLGESGGLISGGEGQRVRLGRGMLKSGVRLAVLDEAFRGLDRGQRQRLTARARELWKGVTMLYVSHDVQDTRDFDKVVVLEAGKVVEHATPAELLARPDSRYNQLLEAERAVFREHWQGTRWRGLRLDSGRIVPRPEMADA